MVAGCRGGQPGRRHRCCASAPEAVGSGFVAVRWSTLAPRQASARRHSSAAPAFRGAARRCCARRCSLRVSLSTAASQQPSAPGSRPLAAIHPGRSACWIHQQRIVAARSQRVYRAARTRPPGHVVQPSGDAQVMPRRRKPKTARALSGCWRCRGSARAPATVACPAGSTNAATRLMPASSPSRRGSAGAVVQLLLVAIGAAPTSRELHPVGRRRCRRQAPRRSFPAFSAVRPAGPPSRPGLFSPAAVPPPRSQVTPWTPAFDAAQRAAALISRPRSRSPPCGRPTPRRRSAAPCARCTQAPACAVARVPRRRRRNQTPAVARPARRCG